MSPHTDLIFLLWQSLLILMLNWKVRHCGPGAESQYKWAHCGLARMDGPALALIMKKAAHCFSAFEEPG